jgi:hypothetical protein
MAIGDILNKAEIAAAEAERARRFQELQQARAKESAFGAANTQTILENIRRTTAAVKGGTEALKQEAAGTISSKKSNKALESAIAEVGATKAAMSPLVSEYKTIQDIISGAESAYSSATVPAPIYEGGDLSSQLAAVIAALSAVGVEGLVPVMADIRKVYPDISSEDALMLLKFDPRFNKPYMTRFAGNKMRMDAGFAPLDDKEYLANEAAYNKIFTAYGLERFANRAEYARQIGNRVAPQELGEKVAATYDRVIKGAAETRKAIQELNPELTDADLMAVALDPATQLPVITRKIQAAEIGGAALAQNLTIGMAAAPEVKSGYTNVTRKGLGVEELLAQGVDLETARRGFANVAEVLPTAEKLSAIYGATLDQYGRLEAEQEQFKGLASAKRKREQLSEREIAAFSGEAGAGRGAFAKERTF